MPNHKRLQFSISKPIGFLVAALSVTVVSPVIADHQVFIQSTGNSPVMLVTDIDNMYLPAGAMADITGRVDLNTGLFVGPGYDDGDHMVVDPVGQRIFVSDHDYDFAVYDFALNLLSPTWGGSLSEPLGLAVMPSGRILVTDEEDGGGASFEGLFRLNSDLSMDAAATGTSSGMFDGLEGIAYDAFNNRIYAADEDDDEIEIFNGSTLAYIGVASASSTSDGPYWLAVDGSSNRLFALYDSRSSDSGDYGIHVFDISGGGNILTFNQTLVGSNGGSSDCIGSIAVSESRNRLFAIDDCSNSVSVFNTVSLAQLASLPSGRSGSQPVMVAVSHLPGPQEIPLLSQWGLLILTAVFVAAGLFGVQSLRLRQRG